MLPCLRHRASKRGETIAKILVTGASGFVGPHAIRSLATRGFEVHAVVRRVPTSKEDDEFVTWHALDLEREADVAALMKEVRPTHLLHLAWETGPAYYTAPTNVDWLRRSLFLCEAFVREGGKRIVGAGSAAEYHLYGGQPLREDSTPLRPNGLYGVCKNALHDVVAGLAKQTGVEVAWGRIFFCYGPGEGPARPIPQVLYKVFAGVPVPFQAGDGFRDYLHVRDVGDALATLAQSDFHGPVNVGSGMPIRFRDVLQAFAEAAGHPEAIQFGALPTPSYEPSMVLADTRRMENDVGWRPKIGLRDGVQETVAWWKECFLGSRKERFDIMPQG